MPPINYEYQYPIYEPSKYHSNFLAYALTGTGVWVERGEGESAESAVASLVQKLSTRAAKSSSKKYKRTMLRHVQRAVDHLFGNAE